MNWLDNLIQKLEEFARWSSKNFSLILFIALLIGVTLGLLFNTSVLVSLIMPSVFFTIYTSMINLEFRKVIEILFYPKLIVTILLLCFIVAPLVALTISIFFPINKGITAGIIMYSLAPSYNGLIGFMKAVEGDINTAVVVQSLTLILSILTFPLGMGIFLATYVAVPYYKMTLTLLIIIIFPLLLCKFTRKMVSFHFGSNIEEKLIEIFPRLSILGIALAYIILSSQCIKTLIDEPYLFLIIVSCAFLFFAILITLVLSLCRILKIKYKFTIVALFGVTFRNNAISLAVCGSLFPEADQVLYTFFICQGIIIAILSKYSQSIRLKIDNISS